MPPQSPRKQVKVTFTFEGEVWTELRGKGCQLNFFVNYTKDAMLICNAKLEVMEKVFISSLTDELELDD